MKKQKTLTFNKLHTNLLKIVISISMFFLIILLSNYYSYLDKVLQWIIVGASIGCLILLIGLFKYNKPISINKKSLILKKIIFLI